MKVCLAPSRARPFQPARLALAMLTALTASGQQAAPAPREQALDFIRNETQFHLGYLPTEQPHPRTKGLSEALRADTVGGIRMLLSVDEDIPPVARAVAAAPGFAQLCAAIRTALDGGKTVYFSGCGATGRLSILLDAANRRFWRETFAQHPELRSACGDMAERTCAVMTGGDFALVRSVEMFEDYVTFGYHQMEQAGVGEGDVVVAISEGGETSSVIGTILRGLDVKAQVFFLFNNPAALLAEKLERCRRVIRNGAVTTLELCTGPMAVAGSTRMQATTIELLVAGMAFESALTAHLQAKLDARQLAALGLSGPGPGETRSPAQALAAFEKLLSQLRQPGNVAALARLADYEADLYARGGRITYFAHEHLLDIFTDTTERSPTFKIPPFRRSDDPVSPAPWAFVKDPLRATPEAWLRVLEHPPRCLDWTPDTYVKLGASGAIRAHPPQIGLATLHKFLIGNEPDASRTEVKPNAAMAVLLGGEAALLDGQPSGAWRDAYLAASEPFESRAALIIGPAAPTGWKEPLIQVAVEIPPTPLRLFAHLAAKLTFNNVSTAAMGKMGRLTSNWMAHVEASNKKLIDRSTRLIAELAAVDYQTACVELFETLEEMKGWDEARRKTVSPAAHSVDRILARRSAAALPPLDWTLGLGDLQGSLRSISPADMRARQVEKTPEAVSAVWKGHPECGDPFTVRVSWQRDAGGVWHGTFGFEGFAGEHFVEEIRFPVVQGELTPDSKFVFGGGDCGLAFPVRGTYKPGSRTIRSFDSGLQMAALVRSERPSLYLDHRDPDWNSKSCEFTVSADGARFSLAGIHYPGAPGKPRESFRIPYESCVGEFAGDWYEAGQIYKQWGSTQRWNARRPAGNPLRKIGLWVWNRGLIGDALPPVERLQKELGDIPVALDWYWWHSNPYDTDYPEFWPPREGVEPFRAAIARLKGQGIYTQVYINGVCWDMDGRTWSEGGAESAVCLRDGQPLNTAFNKYNLHRLAYMCGEAPKFQDKLSKLVGNLRASGLDGQYLDMIGCATFKRCYHPAHRHPKGGGAPGPAGYRSLLERLKRENPGYPLTTEACSEAYLDLFDGAIICNSTSFEHLGGGGGKEMFPLFQSVYHGDYAFFGNYAHPDGITPWDPLWPPEHRWKTEKPWHKLYPHQFFLELGRTVSWGAQPMVCNIKESLFTDPEFAEVCRFVLDTARFYHANRAFLFDGEMLNPAGFSCATQTVEFLARMIFTKEDQARVIRRELPAVLHSCWRAPDGSKALILVNYTDQPQDWTFRGLSGTIPAHSYEKRTLPSKLIN